jgi:hypothetical protein
MLDAGCWTKYGTYPFQYPVSRDWHPVSSDKQHPSGFQELDTFVKFLA